MASNRNHRAAVDLMNRSISQRGIAMSGREMRIALSQHRHPNGSTIAECVIEEYANWAEWKRKLLERKNVEAAERAKYMAEAKAAREKAEKAQKDAERFIADGVNLAQTSEPKYQRLIAAAVAMSHAMFGRGPKIQQLQHRFAGRGS